MLDWLPPTAALGTAGLAASAAMLAIQRRMHVWLPAYLSHRPTMPPVRFDKHPVHVFLSICDHYEPQWGRPAAKVARERVERWRTRYPEIYGRFADTLGRPPQHTFFFPAEEYVPEHLDGLAELCHAGYGDVDIHLHHDNDTAENLRDTLEQFKEALAHRHGLLRRDPVTSELVYGFIHGNWALCNSRRDGRWCGVDRELTVLRETGCYADFTMPSAPADCQTRTINSIYYAAEHGRFSNAFGQPARVSRTPPDESLLMIQGPLGFNWRSRKWGVMPRIENADVHAMQLPTIDRFRTWLDLGVRVEGRPDWVFVKLHTHGAKPGNIDVWLGDWIARFHQQLAELRRQYPALHLYYVTAWEMAQLVRAAEAGQRDPRAVLEPALCYS